MNKLCANFCLDQTKIEFTPNSAFILVRRSTRYYTMNKNNTATTRTIWSIIVRTRHVMSGKRSWGRK